jgi:predicted negative regulator of RcsB-dependent stress response
MALLAAPVAAATVQQDFDTAQALMDAGKAAEARAAFSALLARLPAGSTGQAATLVRARLGNVMLATGDAEAGEAMLDAAIAGFRGNTPQVNEERAIASFDRGRALEIQGKLDSAAASYRAVLASSVFAENSLDDVRLRIALARTLIWSDPAEARRQIDRLLALPPTSFAKDGDSRALLESLRGRVELNNGQPGEARRWFTQAAKSAGGAETQQVTIADIRVRGDLALANFQLNNLDEVQKFIAYSGAGSLVGEGMNWASRTPLPACSPLTGLAPDAVAVVEFTIEPDGRVSNVVPVFASRGSGARTDGVRDDGPEVLFPQAVRRWFWNPENSKKLNDFWRQAVRVELRCETRGNDNDPVWQSFQKDYARWAAGKGVRAMPELDGNDARVLPEVRAEIARREASDGAQSLQMIPPVRTLALNDAAPIADRTAAFARWQALLTAAGAPAAVRGPARIDELGNLVSSNRNRSNRDSVRWLRDGLKTLLAEQEAAGDGATRAAMYTRLRLAEVLDGMKEPAASRALLDTIVAAPVDVVGEADPMRTAALLRIGNQATAARDLATAARAVDATGLTAEQCALVDVRPQPVNATIGSSAFPDAARRWGSGGFVRVGYDITADGATTNVRTIIASPPFVFGPASEKAVSRFRYQPVFRPGNTIGCSGNAQMIRYQFRN